MYDCETAGTQHTGFFCQGRPCMNRHIDRIIQALVFIRLGQDIGADTPAARSIHGFIELLVSLPAAWFR